MEKQLKDNGEKLSAEDKSTVENEIAEFKKIREGGDADAIKSAMESFTQKVYGIFGKLYQQQGGQQPGGETPPPQNADGSVNADYDVH